MWSRPLDTGAFLLEKNVPTFIALWFILFTVVVQFIVAVSAHRMQKDYRVGIIDPSLTQESFFFSCSQDILELFRKYHTLHGISIPCLNCRIRR